MEEPGKNPYIPTKAEERIITAKMNPENRMKSVLELCKIAKVNKETYYKARKKPEFRALLKELVKEVFEHDSLEVAHACLREAKRGSAQHIKMSMEMASVYAEKVEVTTESYADRIKRLLAEKEARSRH